MKPADTSPLARLPTALVVAFCLLMVFVPWEKIWGGKFVDRSVYLNKFSGFIAKSGRPFTGTVTSFILNEVLFDQSVLWFSAKLHVSVAALFGGISFLCLFVFSKYLASRHGLLSLVFLLNPLVIDFAFSQLRLALAVSLLMLALFLRDRRPIAIALAALACFFHTATFLILFIYFSSKWISTRLAARRHNGLYCWLVLLAVGLAVVIAVGPLRVAILSFLGDRRANYANDAQSLLYASFWAILLVAAGTQRKAYFQLEGNSIAVVFLAVFVFGSVFNIYNARFLSAAYPLIISGMLALSAQKRALIIPVYFLYVGAQWYYWVNAGLSHQ